MPADYYSDEEASTAAPPAGPADEARDPADNPGSTAILPKEFFGGSPPEPGSTITLKVLRVHDTQVEVEQADEAEEESAEGEEAPPPAPAPESDPEMAGMME